MKSPGNLITPREAARLLGKTNPEPIKQALRLGTYPIGMAYKSESGTWVYDIPRRPFEVFARTGQVPKLEAELRAISTAELVSELLRRQQEEAVAAALIALKLNPEMFGLRIGA